MSEKQYYISVKRTLVEVTEEQYLCYYRADRRMRYFEHDIKTGTPIRDKNGNITGYTPSKEDSIERIADTGVDFTDRQDSVEDTVIRNLMSDKLHEALDKLPKDERKLVDALFFSNDGNGMIEHKYSKESGVSYSTIAYHRKKIMVKLKILLNN